MGIFEKPCSMRSIAVIYIMILIIRKIFGIKPKRSRIMSLCKYLASDIELPEIDLMNIIEITVKDLKQLNPKPKISIPFDDFDDNRKLVLKNDEKQGLIFVQSDLDFDGLTIAVDDNPPLNTKYHIFKKYIYELNYRFTQKSVTQLIKYLHANTIKSQNIELWSMTVANDEIFEVRNKRQISLSNLTEADLMEMGNRDVCICIDC